MALSGIQIYKLLPQTNCKECGFPTCLAFAMKLAAKQVELSACPYVSEASKTQLAESSAPPVRLVTLKSKSSGICRPAMKSSCSAMKRRFTAGRVCSSGCKDNERPGQPQGQSGPGRGLFGRLCGHGPDHRRFCRRSCLRQPGRLRRRGQSRPRGQQPALDPDQQRSGRDGRRPGGA